MTRSDVVRVVVRVGVTVALAAGVSMAGACASIPLKAWQNGAAMSSDQVIYGDRSVAGRDAYRSYLNSNAFGIRATMPTPVSPPPSRFYW